MDNNKDIFENMRNNAQVENIHRLIDKFKVIHFGHFVAAIPSDTPEEIIVGMLASMGTYSLGNKSIDYFIKTYAVEWDKFPEEDPSLIDEVSEVTFGEIKSVINWASSIKEKPNILGLFLASSALIRLQSSFRSALLLIRLGYVFESAALCRMILEQIAWAYAIHEITDKSALKVSPTQSISKLKTIFPNVGRVNGFLNKFTHIDPALVGHYIEFDKNGESIIVLNSTYQKLEWGELILVLVDLYSLACEYIFRNVADEFARIEYKNGEYFPSKSREMKIAIEKYSKSASKYKSKKKM